MNEAETRVKLIDPAIHKRGWTEDMVRREETAGAIEIQGGTGVRRRGRADYVLRVQIAPNAQPVALALLEAKKADLPPGHGLDQAKLYALGKRLNVKFVFSSNGHLFVEYDAFTGLTSVPMPLDRFWKQRVAELKRAGRPNEDVEEALQRATELAKEGRELAARQGHRGRGVRPQGRQPQPIRRNRDPDAGGADRYRRRANRRPGLRPRVVARRPRLRLSERWRDNHGCRTLGRCRQRVPVAQEGSDTLHGHGVGVVTRAALIADGL